ncbi:MAG: SprT family zinc-dependent metalloprotease [Alistipes sp.]
MICTVTHPQLGEITLSQTLRARRIAISVRSSGAVRISYPYGVSQKQALEFLAQKITWIEQARVRLAARKQVLPTLPPAEAKARLEELRHAAKADLPLRTERLMDITGLKCSKLTIRASRTKWGSCSGCNHISLSLFLMTLPEHLRDYVIIHELCHTAHHNHSPRFHALVDHHVAGHEKTLNRELKSYSILG